MGLFICRCKPGACRSSLAHIAYATSYIAIMVGSTQAMAQAAQTPADRAHGVDEIVVTAQRREQNLQDVPIAITALSQNTLQANRVQNVSDISGLAPGLLARPNAGGLGAPAFSMRGIFASGSGVSQDRQIPIYIDGVYLGAGRGAIFDLPDLERIEVLRGPQGTLFGRNATAGAISVVTRDPTGKFGARQEVTVGNYSQFRSRTTIDTPQFGPLSGYFTYFHDQRRGDVRNLGAGATFDRSNPFNNVGVTRSPKYLGNRNFENVFAAVKFEPSDALKMVYKFDRSNGVTTPEARTTQALNPNSFVGGVLLGVLAAQPAGGGRFGPIVLDPENKRPKATNNAWTQEGFIKALGHNLTTTFEATDSVSIKNVTGYRRSSVYSPSTIAGLSGLEYTAAAKAFYTAPQAFLGGLSYAQALGSNGDFPIGSYFAGYEGQSYGKARQFSTETQVNYNSSFLTLTAGALYYSSRELNGGLPGFRANFFFAPVPDVIPLGNLADATSRTRSIAAYVQGEFHLTPRLDVIAGGRLTRDKKRGGLVTGGVLTGTRADGNITGTTNIPFTFQKTKPTYSFTANYRPIDDLMIYGKYSTGFLSGGAIGDISFQPETVKSVEAGLKGDILDRRLRVNLSLFHAKYKNIQTAIGGTLLNPPRPVLGVVVVSNGGLIAKGFELEVTAAPTDQLTLGGSMGYQHVRLSNPNPILTGGQPFLQSNIAPWIGSAYAQYQTQPLINDAYLFFRLDASFQDKVRVQSNPTIESTIPVFGPYEFMPSRWIMNGRIALRQIDLANTKAEIGLWGRNLTNNKDPMYGLPFGDFQFNSSYQPARTYGVDLIVAFR